MAQKQGRNAYRRELIAEFEALFPPQIFRGLPQHGNEQWTPRIVLWVSVIMFWVSGKTLDEKFSAARRIVKFMRPQWKVPVAYSGFVAAQVRWWPLLRALLMPRLRPDESTAGPAWRVLGWLVLAVDGSRFECPRTTPNEAKLGCAGREKTSPQIFHTLLQHVGTGLPWDFRLGPGTDSERRHLDDMLADLPEWTLLTADAGFISYDLCSQLIDAGQAFVLRIGGNKTLIENLEEDGRRDESIVYFWPQNSQTKQPLKLRRISFKSSGGLPVVLITNVLDAEVLSDEDAQEIYKSRWGIEIYFRHLKQTMGFTSTLSRTSVTSLSEHTWQFLSFWVLQHIAVAHQIAAGKSPRRFSAATARRELREVLQLMQQGKGGKSLARRFADAQVDTYKRKGPKTTRDWPRKKNDQPPKPPNARPAKATEIKKAKALGFKCLLIS